MFFEEGNMFEKEEKAQAAAKERVEQWQLDLTKPGSKVMRFAGRLMIFSEILDPLTGVDDSEEKKFIEETYNQEHMKYYRFGRHHSIVCEDGELGDLHVSTVLAVITEEFYQAVKQSNWSLPRHYQ